MGTWQVTYRDTKNGSDDYEFVQAQSHEEALKKFGLSPVANQGFTVYVVGVVPLNS